jgi:methyl-accepting chemotaxis protein
MKLKIGTKILGCFIILTIIIAFISIKSQSDTNMAKQQYEIVIDVNLPVQTLVAQIRSLNLEQVSAIRGYLLYGDEKYPELYNNINDELDKIYIDIEKKLTTEESKKFLKQIKDTHDNYNSITINILDLAKSNNKEDALEKANEARVYVDEIKTIIDVELSRKV